MLDTAASTRTGLDSAVATHGSGTSFSHDDDVNAPGTLGTAGTPRRALLIVDVQPTFCEGGELPVVGGNATAAAIADYVAANRGKYALVATTQDFHIAPGHHFSANPDFVDTWPPHGLAGSANAELHPLIEPLPIDIRVRKGQRQPAYSGFEGTDAWGLPLVDLLRERGITELDVVGIAESHCVKATALDGASLGYPVTVFTDLTVPVTPELGDSARAEMANAGITLTQSVSS